MPKPLHDALNKLAARIGRRSVEEVMAGNGRQRLRQGQERPNQAGAGLPYWLKN